MGSPSPAGASKLKKESPSKVVVTTPHRRTSSVASSCISLESEYQDVQSLNGLGKSPVSGSPRTPLEKSGSSPAAMKKRRASIGSPDDLARNLDFGTSTSLSIEEKKHPFLTRGGGHKKVVIPATKTTSPVKNGKSTTPPGKEKVVAGRATSASVLPTRKLVEATKKDTFSSSRRSISTSEVPSMNGSINSEGTSSVVFEKKASPRPSLDGKKPSPRPTVKHVASTKSRTNSNGESQGSSPLEAETKVIPRNSVLRKSTSPLPSLKSKPGLTSPRTQKLAKTRPDTPSQPGRVKARIEKAVRNEEVSLSEPVPVCSENGNETEANTENIDGSTLLLSLMDDGNVGDEDMGSLQQGGDPAGFDNDTEMPTSWLSEDLPCMFSSLSHLPEPDDSSSSLLDDPPELLDEPEETISQPKNATVQEPNNATVAAESIMPRSLDAKFVAADSYPSQNSEWNSESNFLNQVESEGEQERAHEDATSELESSTNFDNKAKETLIEFPAVEVPETESQSCETMVTTHFEEISSSLPATTESVASEASENELTEEQNSLPFVEGRSISSHEEPTEVVVPNLLQGGDIFSGENVPVVYISGDGALQEEEGRPAATEEVSSSDDEDLSCSAQLNLKQSFDDAATEVDDRIFDEIALEESPAREQEITVTQLEFADETFSPTTHLDKDMMIFDFEEYWTQNVGDESSDAGQNDAEELQQVETPVEDRGLPAIELPVSSLPGEESTVLEPASPQLDAQSWPSSASDNGQMDRDQESDEVFHVFEGSDQLSLKDDSPSILPEELSNQEPSEPDSSVSPRYTTLETEHCNAVDIGQNLNVLEDKDVEDVTEHQDNTFLVQYESSVVAAMPSVDVDQESLAQAEDLDTPSIFLAVASNDLLGANIQHLDDNDASDESVDTEFLPVGSQNTSSFETPDAYTVYSDDSLDMGPENLEVCATSVKTADDRDTAELLPESSDIARPVSEEAAGTDDSHDLIISKEIGSSMVEGDESNILISGKEVESAISLPPVNGISEEEQTELLFLLSLVSKEEAMDSITDHELLSNLSEEEPQQGLVGGDQLMSVSNQPKENMLSEDETEDQLMSVSNQPEENMLSEDETEDQLTSVSNQPKENMLSEDETEDQLMSVSNQPEENMLSEDETEDQLMPVSNQPEENMLSEDETEDQLMPVSNQPEENMLSEDESEDQLMSVSNQPEENMLSEDESEDQLMSVSNQPEENMLSEDETEDQLMSVSNQPKENMLSEDETEVPEHDNLEMLSGAIEDFRPQEMQSQDDERITTRMESHGDTPNMSEVVDHQPPMPMISEPESLQDAQPLPTGVSSVERSPVFDLEDEMSNENFDSNSEAESTASLHEVDVGTDSVITPTINHTDTAEILEEGEATTPIILSAGELSKLTVNEVGEFDNKLGSEEKWGDFGEQSSKAEQEEADSSGSKSSTEDKKDLLFEELMVTDATVVADERHGTTEDLETDVDESEEATKTISTPASTPDEILECHDQESRLPLETSISTGDKEAALETKEDLVASSDATFDEPDDHAIKDEEIVPDHFSSQDLPLVTSNQHTLNATISDVTEISDLTRFKEGENSNETLEQIPLLKDEDTVVDSPFIHSSLDNMDADEKEENSILPCNLEEERASLKQEDEETVVYSPKNSLLASAQAETPDSTAHLNGMEGHSNISWSGDKEVESFNDELKDTVVQNLGSNGIHTASWKDDSEEVSKPLHKDEDIMSPKNFDTESLDAEEMEEHSWSAGKEEESLNGSLERDEDEDQVVKSQFNVEETTETANSDVVDIQNHSNNSWSEDKSLLEDEDTVVYEPNVEESSPEGVEKVEMFHVPEDTVEYRPTVEKKDVEEVEMFHVPEDTVEYTPTVENPGVEEVEMFHVPEDTVEYTPIVENPGVDEVEMFHVPEDTVEYTPIVENPGVEKVEMFHVPEDTVEYTPTVEKPGVEKVEMFHVPEDTVENRPIVEKPGVEKVEMFHVPEDTVECRSTVENPGVEKMEVCNVPDADTTNAAIVDDVEEHKSFKNGYLEGESKLEVEDNKMQSEFVAPDLLDANFVVADELENQTDKDEKTLHEEKSLSEVEDTVTVESSKPEQAVASDATETSNLVVADELENQTDKEEETLHQHPEAKSVKETVEESSKESSFVAPDLLNGNDTSNSVVETVEEKSIKESSVVSNEDNAGAETLDAEDLDKHGPTWKTNNKESLLEEEPTLLVSQDTAVDNVKQESVQCLTEVNGEIQSSSGTANLSDEEGLEPHGSSQAVHSTPEVNGAIQSTSGTTVILADKAGSEPHESSRSVHSTEVEHSLDVPGVTVQTDTADAKDCASDSKPIDTTNGEMLKNSNAPEDETNLQGSKSAPTDTSPQGKDCASDIKPIDRTNGENLRNSDAPVDSESNLTAPGTKTPDLEPQSPTATLYPLSQPPFSGSQQDRLWEEQAEAYNSGQGTPRSVTQAGAPCDSPSKVVPVETDDQIQPVTPANGNRNAVVVVGDSNGGGENGASTTAVQDEQQQPKERIVNKKEKLHTPLRSLLLEDAGGYGDTVTPNAVVTSSPSFIRRLFRVMSTSSRSSEREAKLKKSSSSLWVSCLGSPQVQQ